MPNTYNLTILLLTKSFHIHTLGLYTCGCDTAANRPNRKQTESLHVGLATVDKNKFSESKYLRGELRRL